MIKDEQKNDDILFAIKNFLGQIIENNNNDQKQTKIYHPRQKDDFHANKLNFLRESTAAIYGSDQDDDQQTNSSNKNNKKPNKNKQNIQTYHISLIPNLGSIVQESEYARQSLKSSQKDKGESFRSKQSENKKIEAQGMGKYKQIDSAKIKPVSEGAASQNIQSIEQMNFNQIMDQAYRQQSKSLNIQQQQKKGHIQAHEYEICFAQVMLMMSSLASFNYHSDFVQEVKAICDKHVSALSQLLKKQTQFNSFTKFMDLCKTIEVFVKKVDRLVMSQIKLLNKTKEEEYKKRQKLFEFEIQKYNKKIKKLASELDLQQQIFKGFRKSNELQFRTLQKQNDQMRTKIIISRQKIEELTRQIHKIKQSYSSKIEDKTKNSQHHQHKQQQCQQCPKQPGIYGALQKLKQLERLLQEKHIEKDEQKD